MALQAIITAAPAPGADDVPHLTGTQGLELAAIVVVGVLLVGVIIVWARSMEKRPTDEPGGSVIRSWVALSLVLGLLAFCAVAFAIGDKASRSALLGALTASVGAAIAFYFSQRASEATVAAVVKGQKDLTAPLETRGSQTPPP